jgi:REP-associated tyrosine transposase
VARYEVYGCLVPRPPRSFESGFLYHLTPKGNDGGIVLSSDEERERLLRRCEFAFVKYRVEVVAFVFLDNHLHFLVRAGHDEDAISRALQEILGGHSRWRNRKDGRRGHRFENRFHSRKIRSEMHLYNTLRYIALNPVRAGMVDQPEDWKWGSYRAQIGREVPPRFLAFGLFLSLFSNDPAKAVMLFETLVREGVEATRRKKREP